MEIKSNVKGSVISLTDGVKILGTDGNVHYYKLLTPNHSLKLGGQVGVGDAIGELSDDSTLYYEFNKYKEDIDLPQKVLAKHWADCAINILNQNSVITKQDFNINEIPYQALYKVNSKTSNEDIGFILSAIKSINGAPFYVASKEGEELMRIKTLLEFRINKCLDLKDFSNLNSSASLLNEIKLSLKNIN